jgi:hypothetical protein
MLAIDPLEKEVRDWNYRREVSFRAVLSRRRGV